MLFTQGSFLRRRLLMFVLFVSIIGCDGLQSNRVRGIKDFSIDVIYGEDNRRNLYEVSDENWRELALSTAILVDKDRIRKASNKQVELIGKDYGKHFNLCDDEPFYEEQFAGFCSAFLIGPDLLVTAGHCIRNDYNCKDVRIVFDHFQKDAEIGAGLVPAKSVHQCKEIIHTQANGISGSDFAILRLKKKVKDRNPLLIRTSGVIDPTAKLTVIGYPSGLPGKLADGGAVIDNSTAAFFLTTLDTYYGNSGSAVFNSDTRLIEGLLFRGDDDFVYDNVSKCRRSKVCTAGECDGEGVVRISEILEHITPSDLQ